MRIPMGTGGTDLHADSAFLLIGWDGRVVQWALGHSGAITKMRKEIASDAAGIAEICQSIHDQEVEAASVVFHFRHALFSLAPATVVRGVENEVVTLHAGPGMDIDSVRSFHSDVFGEELVLMERIQNEAWNAVQQVWPQAKLESSSLRWLEAAVNHSRDENRPQVYIDLSSHKVLLARFDEGELAWSMVSSDLDGEGVLYSVVNAMHRDGLAPGADGTHVFLSGDIEEGHDVVLSFRRFFPKVEIFSGWFDGRIEPAGIKTQQWALLTQLASCA